MLRRKQERNIARHVLTAPGAPLAVRDVPGFSGFAKSSAQAWVWAVKSLEFAEKRAMSVVTGSRCTPVTVLNTDNGRDKTPRGRPHFSRQMMAETLRKFSLRLWPNRS